MPAAALTDIELLSAFKNGDNDAYSALYDRYWKPLYIAAYKRLNNKEQAEDIVQNIFVSLWTRREALQVNDVAGYLFTAVRYAVLALVSRNKVSGRFYELFDEVLHEPDTPERRLAAKDLINLVYAYAKTLPEKRRQIFLLHIKDRLSTAEIAELLSVSQKTVQNQLRTALLGLYPHVATALVILLRPPVDL